MKKKKQTRLYYKKKRIESDNQEIANYLEILNHNKTNHKTRLQISISTVEDEIDFSKKSLDNILKKTNEKIGYFIAHILFIHERQVYEEDIKDFKIVEKYDNKFGKQIYFESIFNISKPLEVPFEMSDDDFEKFNKFSNKKF